MLGRLFERAGRRSERVVADGIVSVVIPLFNHQAFVADAIRSIVEQGPLVREIIVVDDGSTDGSAALAQALATADDRIVTWSQPNRGAHRAIEAGIARSTGDIVSILNSDDSYEPGRLKAIVAAFSRDPDAAMVTTGVTTIDAGGRPQPNPWYDEAVAFHQRCGDLGTALLNGNLFVTTSNYAFRRSLVDRIGRFAPLRYAHDLDFALRVLAERNRIVRLDEPLLRYRTHATNTISEDHANVRVEWALAAGAYLARRFADSAPDGTEWRRRRVLLETLERHRIHQAAQLVAAYLRAERTQALDRSAVTGDTAFLDVLREIL